MEPNQQVEIQLGHMCNNRCVFCVSGQETARRRALPLMPSPILQRISEAYAKGHRKLTLLGGEPTLQPAFKEVLAHAHSLGFEEIVVFTNGVKTARRAFVEELLQISDRIHWRISIQGATRESHERTTKKPGSFARIVSTLGHLRDLRQTISVNMCVVQSNYESVDHFPKLLMPYGVRQLHLDMVRPMDAGERTEAEYEGMIPDYRKLVSPLRRMVAGFPAEFDVNIGNLPYCIAPELAHRIHHDGEQTETIAVDGSQSLSEGWDKYAVKRRDKRLVETCSQCAYRGECSGYFERYLNLYGNEHAEALGETDFRTHPKLAQEHPASYAQSWLDRVEAEPRTEEANWTWQRHENGLRVSVPAEAAGSSEEAAEVLLRVDQSGYRHVGQFRVDTASPEHSWASPLVYAALVERGAEAFFPPRTVGKGRMLQRLLAHLSQFEARAYWRDMRWRRSEVGMATERIELHFDDPNGETFRLWASSAGGRIRFGYAYTQAAAGALTESQREELGALVMLWKKGQPARRAPTRGARRPVSG